MRLCHLHRRHFFAALILPVPLSHIHRQTLIIPSMNWKHFHSLIPTCLHKHAFRAHTHAPCRCFFTLCLNTHARSHFAKCLWKRKFIFTIPLQWDYNCVARYWLGGAMCNWKHDKKGQLFSLSSSHTHTHKRTYTHTCARARQTGC